MEQKNILMPDKIPSFKINIEEHMLDNSADFLNFADEFRQSDPKRKLTKAKPTQALRTSRSK